MAEDPRRPAPRSLRRPAPRSLRGPAPRSLRRPAPRSLRRPAPRSLRRPAPRSLRRLLLGGSGQATVELVALLPLIAIVALGAWQVAIAGHSIWAAGAAARAAARAEAVGGDTAAAARRLLPESVRRAADVRAEAGGEVRVEVPIPAVVGGGSLFTTTARARFEPQR